MDDIYLLNIKHVVRLYVPKIHRMSKKYTAVYIEYIVSAVMSDKLFITQLFQ